MGSVGVVGKSSNICIYHVEGMVSQGDDEVTLSCFQINQGIAQTIPSFGLISHFVSVGDFFFIFFAFFSTSPYPMGYPSMCSFASRHLPLGIIFPFRTHTKACPYQQMDQDVTHALGFICKKGCDIHKDPLQDITLIKEIDKIDLLQVN